MFKHIVEGELRGTQQGGEAQGQSCINSTEFNHFTQPFPSCVTPKLAQTTAQAKQINHFQAVFLPR